MAGLAVARLLRGRERLSLASASIECNDSTTRGRRMATLTIRGLDDDLKAALRLRAAQHGRSMESEVREILRTVLVERSSSGPGMAARISRRFADVGGADVELPNRTEPPRAAELG